MFLYNSIPWWGFALLAVMAVSGLNVCFKWALNQKIPAEKLFLLIFSGYFVGYLLMNSSANMAMISDTNHLKTLIIWGIIVAAFSFVANYFSAIAYTNAPNPGYVEGIKSSNAILTTVLALIIFSSPISWLKWLGILLIPVGLLSFKSQKTDIKTQNEWLMPAVLSAVFFSGMFVVYKQMSILGFSRLEILISLSLFAGIGFLIMTLYKKTQWIYTPKVIWPIILCIMTGLLANWLIVSAVSLSANPGPSQAIFNLQAVVTMIGAKFIFRTDEGGHFHLNKWLGVVIVVIGTIIIVLG